MLRLLCLCFVVYGVRSDHAPFITPCKNGDNDCVMKSTQVAVPILAEGIPTFGIAPLDPMTLDEINGDQGPLQLTFRNTIVTGLKNCHVEAVKSDISKGKQATSMKCDVDLTGDYKLGGQLIVLPIRGEGKYHITIRDMVIKTVVDLSKVQKGDSVYWHISDWHHSFKVLTKATFQFDNLFNGNQILAGPVTDFMNNSWDEVMEEIAPPIVKAIATRVIEAVEKLYAQVPEGELVL